MNRSSPNTGQPKERILKSVSKELPEIREESKKPALPVIKDEKPAVRGHTTKKAETVTMKKEGFSIVRHFTGLTTKEFLRKRKLESFVK